MGAPSKRAKRVRNATEFDVARLQAEIKRPIGSTAPTINAWSLQDIFAAREEQMLGIFFRPARMAEQMRTDDALAVAYENRLAPQRCIPVKMVPAKGARGTAIAGEGDALFGPRGVSIDPGSIDDIEGCLVNHGVAFAQVTWTPREDGTRVDPLLRYWPVDLVRWEPISCQFITRADMSDLPAGEPLVIGEIPIVHGDGRWVIFTKHQDVPYRQEAAILPAALVWARHAYAMRDWARGSVAHGIAKLMGELPAGVSLTDETGALTPEANAFLSMLQAVESGAAAAGIRPAGSKTDFLVNASTAWQVWSELGTNAAKAAARIYLGTDGTLGTQGGAPGIDITALFGVAKTKVEGDLKCIERALLTGLIEPWCAINFGDSSLAPRRVYVLPNTEADAVAKNKSERNAAFFAALVAANQAGMRLDPAYVAALAGDYGVRAPIISASAPAPSQTGAASTAPPTAPPVGAPPRLSRVP